MRDTFGERPAEVTQRLNHSRTNANVQLRVIGVGMSQRCVMQQCHTSKSIES